MASDEKNLFNPSYRRQRGKERHELSGKAYLERYHIRRYLQDAVSLLLSSDEPPVQFLANYFSNVANGENVLFRQFKYINCTPQNRRAFLWRFKSTYANYEQEMLTPESFHQLLLLLCPDFPFSLVRNASRITLDVMQPSNLIEFETFSRKLFILFFFSEYMNQAALAFRTIDHKSTGRVHRRTFCDSLIKIIRNNSNTFSCPPAFVIQDVLLNDKKTKKTKTDGKNNKHGNKANAEENDDDSDSDSAGDTNGGEDDELTMFNAFCVSLFNHPVVHQALLEPTNYSTVRSNILKTFKADAAK